MEDRTRRRDDRTSGTMRTMTTGSDLERCGWTATRLSLSSGKAPLDKSVEPPFTASLPCANIPTY